MSKITMYPTAVRQPNRNQPSGLQGKCFKAIRRNGTSYDISCQDQKDPKYHHEWSNAEEILFGRTIQCGRKSTKMCSHETYYGIKGYRNTCPIAGVTGTYTKPATLRLFFDLSKKGISSTSKINSVRLSFEHRCTGVDVATGKESVSWGPNFSGGNIYPNYNALTIKIGNQKKISEKNPPLSSKFSSTGVFVFTNVSYKNLVTDGVDIIYGNNLETNPGNIYIKNLKIEVDYTDEVAYIEGRQGTDSLYISPVETCRTHINFLIEAGYKQGNKKLSKNNAPRILQNSIIATTPDANLITITYTKREDGKTVLATLKDKTNVEGKKKISFRIAGTKKSVSFEYNAIKRKKPTITIPTEIQRNTKNTGITSIVAKNGCTNSIKVYVERIKGSPYHTFTSFNLSNQNNIIPVEDREAFYIKLAQLPCGDHKLYFKRDDESNDEAVLQNIRITPTKHKFIITTIEDNGNEEKELKSCEFLQNKNKNEKLLLTYVPTTELITYPNFTITNSSHGKEDSEEKPTSDLIDNEDWNHVGYQNIYNHNLTIGTYYPGDYEITIKETECPETAIKFPIKIIPKHRQYYDEIFVRGEDSTAFDYDYLVALEGDSITEPLSVKSIKLGASYQDIRICTVENSIAGLTEIKPIKFTVSNVSDNDIENLFLELNTIIKNENGAYQVTSNEWLEPDGIFYNFKENFERFNNNYIESVNIKNLTKDDDKVDEEDVYIHIAKLKANSEIDLLIPFGSGIEKEVFLQILLFGQPIQLYSIGACSDSLKSFNLMSLNVYDSILTDISITGESDLFSLQTEMSECPKECFKTSMTYNIKNIDTNTLEKDAYTIISNDPRLSPYKYNYKGVDYNLEEENQPNIVSFIQNNNAVKSTPIVGGKIDLYIKFDEHEEEHYHQYTDSDGIATFFLTIPKTVGGSFNIDELLKYISAEFKGNKFYNGSSQTTEYRLTENKNLVTRKNGHQSEVQIIPNQIRYKAGQVIPIKIKLIGHNYYIQNDIVFKPNIKNPGDSDNITIFYEACNLTNNEGVLNTKFTTDISNYKKQIRMIQNSGYELVPNEINKSIYCGIDTNKELYTRLTKIIVENKSINRLKITLSNFKRDNKDIKIYIKENMTIKKYDIIDYNLDKGTLSFDKDFIIWSIDYIDADNIVTGYIDFKAKEVGHSILETKVVDFIDDMIQKGQQINFGKDLYKCDCNKNR